MQNKVLRENARKFVCATCKKACIINIPPYFRFVGGTMNTCYEAIDVHVEKGFGEHVGLIYDSPVTGKQQNITYNQLQEQVFHSVISPQNFGEKSGFPKMSTVWGGGTDVFMVS